MVQRGHVHLGGLLRIDGLHKVHLHSGDARTNRVDIFIDILCLYHRYTYKWFSFHTQGGVIIHFLLSSRVVDNDID